MTKKFDAPLEDRDVENYRREAMAMITKWGPYWMKYDEDCVTNVATSIAKAEHAFDPDRGLKRVTLRCTMDVDRCGQRREGEISGLIGPYISQ